MSVLTITLFIWIVFPIGHRQEPSNSQLTQIADPKFDEWGDIPFSEEKARLDNAAIQWQGQPRYIIYLVIYAGQRACIGEAKARGERAKNHLVKRHVLADHVVWVDGGWKKEVSTEVWMWPPRIRKPSVFPEFNLKRSEVKLEKNCKIKWRRRSTG